MSWRYTYNGENWSDFNSPNYISSAALAGSGDLKFKTNSNGVTPYSNTVNANGKSNISGPLKNSVINGSGADDEINVQGAGNTIHGNSGKDNISGSGSLYGDAGDDNISGSGNLYGGTGEDNISGSGLLEGGKDDDDITADAGCHTHDTISYSSGDGYDQINGFGNNDLFDISGGTTAISANGSNVDVSLNGSLIATYNNPGKKFIHLDKNGKGTYLLDGTTLLQPMANFTGSSTITGNDTNYIYNEAHDVTINARATDSWIYNDDKSDRTIIKPTGSITKVEDHSALAAVALDGFTGSIILDDIYQYYDRSSLYSNGFDSTSIGTTTVRDNITHYYGAGLLTFEGSKSAAQSALNAVNLSAASNTYTLRYKNDDDTYSYLRYWNGKWYNSYVYRNDDRTGNLNPTTGGTFDNPNSADLFVKNQTEFTEEPDYIYMNFGRDKSINALEGDDYIYNWGMEYSSILGSEGKDTIYNNHSSYTTHITIDAGVDDDYVYNNSDYVSIVAGLGEDEVINYNGDKVVIHGDDGSGAIDDGADIITNYYGSSVTITGGKGEDSIYNYSSGKKYEDGYHSTSSGDSVSIDGGDDADYIYSEGAYNTISGGTGDDTIGNYSAHGPAVIYGGIGNDSVENWSSASTVIAGEGDDSIWNYSTVGAASIDGGIGNDYIYNKSSRSTITGGTGKDTIINNSTTGPASIDGGSEDNYIFNQSYYSTITALSGNDTIYNMFSTGPASINAGDGNNFIYNNSSQSTLLSGNGADRIYNTSSYGRAIISSGGGNDTIYNHSYHATITGGTGNDSIVDDTANSQINYSSGDGNDVITFAKTSDYRGKDNIIPYYGGGLIALTDGTTHSYGGYSNTSNSINITPSKYTVQGGSSFSLNSYSYTVNGSFTLGVGSSKLTVNTNCFTVREGTDTKNYTYKRYWADYWTGSSISAKEFNSFVYLDDKHNEDTIGTYDDPNYSYLPYKTNDSLAYTNKDDYIFVNFGTNKIINAREGDDYINNYGASYSTIIGGTGKDTIYNKKGSAAFSDHTCLTGDGKTDHVTIDGGDDKDYIDNESTDVSINAGADNDTIYNRSDGTSSTVDAAAGDDYISNAAKKSSLVGGKGNDSIYNSGDSSTINAGYDGAENTSIADADYVRNTGDYVSVVTGYGNDTIYNGSNGYYSDKGGYVTIDSGAGDDSITNISTNGPAYIFAGEGDNYVKNYASSSKITADSGDDRIYNLSNSNVKGTVIDAGEGANYIENNAGQAKITTGSDNDTIFNFSTSTNATILAGDGDNTITNHSSQSTIISKSGDDIINNMNINKKIYIDSGDGSDSITNYTGAPTIFSGDGNDTIFNHFTKDKSDAATINLGKGDDRLFFDYASKVTIDFGEGNDIVSMSGSNGDNKFIIDDYDGEDTSHNIVYGARILRDGDVIVNGTVIHNNMTIVNGNSTVATMAVGREERDLLVSLDSGDFTYFVDVLKPKPVFNAMAAVVIDNKTPNNQNDNIKEADDINLKDKKKNSLTKYNLDNMTTVLGSFKEEELESASLGSFFDLFSNSKVTLDTGNNEKGQNTGLGFNVDGSIVAGVVTVVGSGYTIDGSSVIASGEAALTRDNELKKTDINPKTKKTTIVANDHYDKINYTTPGSAATTLLEESISSIYRTTPVTIEGNDAYNFIVGGKGNDFIHGGSKGDDTIEGGAGKDTLKGGHDSVTGDIVDRINNNNYFPNTLEVAYFQQQIDYANTFVVRAYSPTISAYSKNHSNEYTILDFEEQDVLKVADGFIEMGDFQNNSTLRLIVKNNPLLKENGVLEDTTQNKATVNILNGKNKKIKIINQDGTFSRQLYGAEAIVVGADDGETINTAWNQNVVTIDGSTRITPVGLAGNSKNNLIISGISDNTVATGGGNDTIVYIEGNDVITDYGVKGNDIVKIPNNQAITSITTVESAFYTGAVNNNIDAAYALNTDDSITILAAVTKSYKGKTTIFNKKKINFVRDDGYTLQGSGTDLTLKVTENNVLDNGNQINTATLSPAINLVDASALSYKVNKKTYYYDMDIKIEKGTIKGSNGNDTLTGGLDSDVLIGGAGNNILDGGSGNDVLTGNKGDDVFILSEGNDTITDYSPFETKNNGDYIKLPEGQVILSSTIIQRTKHVLLTIGDENNDTIGTVQINNGKGKLITIGDETLSFGDNTATLYAKNGTDISSSPIKCITTVVTSGNIGIELNGTGEAEVLIGGNGDDTIAGLAGDDTLIGGKGDDIFIYSAGNDIITDYSPLATKNNGDRISLASNQKITATSLNGKNITLTIGNADSDSIGSIQLTNGINKEITVNDETFVVGKDNLVTLKSSLGENIDISESAFITSIDAAKYKAAANITGSTQDNALKGGSGDDKIFGNEGNDTIYGGAGNDSIDGGSDNDKILGEVGADTLNGGEGNDSLTGGAGNDVFIYSSGNDVITDYSPLATKNNGDSIILADNQTIKNVTMKGKNVLLTIGNGTLQINNGKNKEITINNQTYVYGDGEATLKSSTDASPNIFGDGLITAVDASKSKIPTNIIGNAKNNLLKGGTADDIIEGLGGNDTIYGGAGNDLIIGSGSDNKLFGEAGNDTLRGGNGNNTLTGGIGDDVFEYSRGDYVITDYSPLATKNNGDSITLGEGQRIIGSEIISKKHLKLTIGIDDEDTINTNGNIQLNNGKGKIITIDGKNYTFGDGAATLNTTVDASISNKNFAAAIDASKVTNGVKLIGNDDDNILKGGTGADTLEGGKAKGYDTLTGGKGNDIFVYGDGNIIITDYAAGDVISLPSGVNYSWEITGTGKNKKDVTFTIGNNSIEVKNGKGKDITVNNYTHKKCTLDGSASTSSKNFVEDTWFTQDDHFVSDDLNSILQTNSIDYSTENIINTDNLFSKDINLITLNSNKKSTRNA